MSRRLICEYRGLTTCIAKIRAVGICQVEVNRIHWKNEFSMRNQSISTKRSNINVGTDTTTTADYLFFFLFLKHIVHCSFSKFIFSSKQPFRVIYIYNTSIQLNTIFIERVKRKLRRRKNSVFTWNMDRVHGARENVQYIRTQIQLQYTASRFMTKFYTSLNILNRKKNKTKGQKNTEEVKYASKCNIPYLPFL